MQWADFSNQNLAIASHVQCPGAPRCGCREEGTGSDVGLWSAKRHGPKGSLTEGLHGSGSGRTNAQDFMVAGGSSLFCKLICLFFSLVRVSHSVPWPCPKPACAPIGCVAAGFPSLFLSGESLPARTFLSHFHATFLKFWLPFHAICSVERMKTETASSFPLPQHYIPFPLWRPITFINSLKKH